MESKILVIINEVLSSTVVFPFLPHLHMAGFVLLPSPAAAASCFWATHGARNVPEVQTVFLQKAEGCLARVRFFQENGTNALPAFSNAAEQCLRGCLHQTHPVQMCDDL